MVKNESRDFGKVHARKPHKCIQNEVGKVWGQKELILVGVIYVVWYCLFLQLKVDFRMHRKGQC